MSFWELLKIEFMKVKRGKIVPLIFIAPLLVVRRGKSTQLLYPGIYERMGCYVHSKCISLFLLSASVQHDCSLCNDCRTGNRK